MPLSGYVCQAGPLITSDKGPSPPPLRAQPKAQLELHLWIECDHHNLQLWHSCPWTRAEPSGQNHSDSFRGNHFSSRRHPTFSLQ